MGGTDKRSGELFSYVDLERRLRKDHPSTALAVPSSDFAALYLEMGVAIR